MRPRTFLAVTAALVLSLVVVSFLVGNGPASDASGAFHWLVGVFGATRSAGRPAAGGHEAISRNGSTTASRPACGRTRWSGSAPAS